MQSRQPKAYEHMFERAGTKAEHPTQAADQYAQATVHRHEALKLAAAGEAEVARFHGYLAHGPVTRAEHHEAQAANGGSDARHD